MVLNERGYSSLELIVAVLTMAVTFYGNALDMGVVGGIYSKVTAKLYCTILSPASIFPLLPFSILCFLESLMMPLLHCAPSACFYTQTAKKTKSYHALHLVSPPNYLVSKFSRSCTVELLLEIDLPLSQPEYC